LIRETRDRVVEITVFDLQFDNPTLDLFAVHAGPPPCAA
jgi:hypothetical protein